MLQLPCDGELEEESGQAGNEIAAVNVDLDSVGDDGTAPEEEELPSEEEQSIPIRRVMPVDDFNLMRIAKAVKLRCRSRGAMNMRQ
jgi:hypothetical protein